MTAKHVRQLKDLQSVSSVAVRCGSPDELLVATVDAAQRVLKPDCVLLYECDGPNLRLHSSRGHGGTPPDCCRHCRPGECLCGLAAADARTVCSEDIRSDARCVRDECRQAGFRSVVSIPLRGVDGVCGVLTCASGNARDFGRESDFLEALSALSGAGLESIASSNGLKKRIAALSEQLEQARAAENTLREREAQYRNLVDSVPGVIYRFSTRRGGLFYSHQVRQILGYEPGELLAQPFLWNESIHPADRTKVDGAIEGIKKGRPFCIDYRLRDATGRWLWLNDSSVTVTQLGDECVVEGLAVDTTSRMHDEERATQLRDGVQEAMRLSHLGELAASLAHELGQPLFANSANSRAISRLLSRDPPDLAKIGEAVSAISRDTQRAVDVLVRVRALLGRGEGLRCATLDLRDQVRAVLDILAPRIKRAHVVVNCRLPATCPSVVGNNGEIQQVLVNLINNAVDSLLDVPCERRVLTLEVMDDYRPGMVTCAVRDTGKGFSQEALSTAFRSFASTKSTGMGLGLAICRRILTEHGGDVWVEPCPDGATVMFAIPRGKRGRGSAAQGEVACGDA